MSKTVASVVCVALSAAILSACPAKPAPDSSVPVIRDAAVERPSFDDDDFDVVEMDAAYEPDPLDPDVYTFPVPHEADAESAGDPDAGDSGVDPRSPVDRPIADEWPAVNAWSDEFEREYTRFVAKLGEGVAARRCGRLDRCLRNPEYNTLYDERTDRGLYLNVDCADLPYVLRAYFAFKRKLPFGYTFWVDGAPSRAGKDPRYMVGIVPGDVRNWWRHRTFRSLIRDMGSWVHSGMYRVSARREGGDFYTVAVNRQNVRPGTTFYDPNGHVLVVTSVEPDGSVFMMDGHPDGSLTSKRFGAAFVAGTYDLGGGFKNFRPVRLEGRQARPTFVNAAIAAPRARARARADVRARVLRAELHADARLALGHHREREADHVDALASSASGHLVRERGVAEHDRHDGVNAGLDREARGRHPRSEARRVAAITCRAARCVSSSSSNTAMDAPRSPAPACSRTGRAATAAAAARSISRAPW
jgi:hypothetical protein